VQIGIQRQQQARLSIMSPKKSAYIVVLLTIHIRLIPINVSKMINGDTQLLLDKQNCREEYREPLARS
jgi:hypothetical protein